MLHNNDLLYSGYVLNTMLSPGFHKRAYKVVKEADTNIMSLERQCNVGHSISGGGRN